MKQWKAYNDQVCFSYLKHAIGQRNDFLVGSQKLHSCKSHIKRITPCGQEIQLKNWKQQTQLYIYNENRVFFRATRIMENQI